MWSWLLFVAHLACAVDLPNVTLPWGTWQASSSNEDPSFYTFPNIQFGAPTNGTNRFQISKYPDPIPDPGKVLRDNSYGPKCAQVTGNAGKCATIPVPIDLGSEDCLYLDVYVPKAVWDARDAADAPVIVWTYGGAYMIGAKDQADQAAPFYSGESIIEAAAALGARGEPVTFVTGSYRLGAFGWLAGPSMQEHGMPNAGLYDQRLVFEFVRDFIDRFGGSRDRVTAWGESAGAGSITHHLVRGNGSVDPLFQRAFLQSPAFEWQWDRSANGTLEQTYQRFAKMVDCPVSGPESMECLQNASFGALTAANERLLSAVITDGVFLVGPSVDDAWLSYLPSIAMEKGLYWTELDSLIVSHTTAESEAFTPKYVVDELTFDAYIKKVFPEPALEEVRQAIRTQYPAFGSPYYGNAQARTADVLRHAMFTCNNRALFDAYAPRAPTYLMEYAFGVDGVALHATDLLPVFVFRSFDLRDFLDSKLCLSKGDAAVVAAALQTMAPKYKRYAVSHALAGDPNKVPSPIHKTWRVATPSKGGGEWVENVMRVSLAPFNTFDPAYKDKLLSHSVCDFWMDVAHNVSGLIRKQRQGLPAEANEQGGLLDLGGLEL